jgi:uncharacterized membrane protein YbhN (UPF0104 family)
MRRSAADSGGHTAEVTGVVDHLGGTIWYALVVALALHAAGIVARSRAWRNVLADDFPEERVPWRGIFGAYAAGLGLNALLPARLGDVVKLMIAKRQVPSAGYPALLSSLFVLSLVDAVLALGFVCWATSDGAMPGVDLLVRHPAAAGGWLTAHLVLTLPAALLALAAAATAVRLCRGRVAMLRAGFARGFAVLRDWRFFLGSVVTWQGAGWALQLASFWWFLRAFHLPATIHDAALVQAVGSVAIAIPITPSGAGAEQALLIMAFGQAPSADAVVGFAVGMRLAMIVLDALLGLAATLLLLRTLRLHRLLHAEDAIHEHLGAWTGRLLLRGRRPIRPSLLRPEPVPQPVVVRSERRLR